MDVLVTTADTKTGAQGVLRIGDATYSCALGRGGVRLDKKEGDGATPVGCFPLRRVFYRADKIAAPKTALPLLVIHRADGWCDDPNDAFYNRQVRLPHAGHCETLWREDGLYDVVVVLGHNDNPVVPGRGSAIFLHVAKPDLAPTEGCVALRYPDLLEALKAMHSGDKLCVED